MKLYYYAPSHHSRRVAALIHQLGLDVDWQHLDLSQGEQRTEEIRALNPSYNLPILVDGDFTLWESNAIMQYLCDSYGGEALYPVQPRQRARVNQWLSWQMCHLSQPTNSYMFERLIKPLLGQDDADEQKLEEAGVELTRQLEILEEQLSKAPYVCGDALSIADLAIASCLMYADAASMPWGGFENIRSWFGRIEALPAWQACAAG